MSDPARKSEEQVRGNARKYKDYEPDKDRIGKGEPGPS